MEPYKDITDTEVVDEGLLVTFDFKRESGDQIEWDDIEEEFVTIPSEVRTESVSFLFTTEQIESLRLTEDEEEQTDEEIIEILTNRCIENLKGVE